LRLTLTLNKFTELVQLDLLLFQQFASFIATPYFLYVSAG